MFADIFLLHELQAQRNFPQAHFNDYGLFEDENGLLRSRGRIENNLQIKANTKFPQLQTKENYLTALIILQVHFDALHAGPAITLSQLRTKFWVPQGHKTVAKVIRNYCFKCLIFYVKNLEDSTPFFAY